VRRRHYPGPGGLRETEQRLVARLARRGLQAQARDGCAQIGETLDKEGHLEAGGERPHRFGLALRLGPQRVVDVPDRDLETQPRPSQCQVAQGGCQRDRIGAPRAGGEHPGAAGNEGRGPAAGLLDSPVDRPAGIRASRAGAPCPPAPSTLSARSHALQHSGLARERLFDGGFPTAPAH
jgi:hypothetical protein